MGRGNSFQSLEKAACFTFSHRATKCRRAAIPGKRKKWEEEEEEKEEGEIVKVAARLQEFCQFENDSFSGEVRRRRGGGEKLQRCRVQFNVAERPARGEGGCGSEKIVKSTLEPRRPTWKTSNVSSPVAVTLMA